MNAADEDPITGDGTGTRRWWGTEERPTALRKAWWVLKEAFFMPWGR